MSCARLNVFEFTELQVDHAWVLVLNKGSKKLYEHPTIFALFVGSSRYDNIIFMIATFILLRRKYQKHNEVHGEEKKRTSYSVS